MTAATTTTTATMHDDPEDPRGILVRVPDLQLTVRVPRSSGMYAEIDRAMANVRPGARLHGGFHLVGNRLQAVVRLPEQEQQ